MELYNFPELLAEQYYDGYDFEWDVYNGTEVVECSNNLFMSS